MKKTGITILAFSALLIIQGCKKTEYQDRPPQLKIVVKDASNALISGANVSLFLTAEDFQQNTNTISTAITGDDGSTTFTELDEVNYFFAVESNGKSNHFGVAATSEPLEKGYIVTIETIIE